MEVDANAKASKAPMTHERLESKSGVQNRHHHHPHLHTKTLADGTTIKKYKKKKRLPDGSSIVKTVTKSVPLQPDPSHLIKKIRTKTKETYPDGISHTTTIVEEVITANDASVNHVMHPSERHVSNLPDGTELVTSKEVKTLPDGNLSLVTIMVHTVIRSAIPANTIAEKAESMHAAPIGSNTTKDSNREDELHNAHGAATPPEYFQDTTGFSRQISHDVSLETFDGHADHALLSLAHLDNIKGNEANNSSYLDKTLEKIEGNTYAPLPDEYMPDNNEEGCTKSASTLNKSVETIDSRDQPMPMGCLQDFHLEDGGDTSRGVGARFVLPSESKNDSTEAKLKAKERDFQQGTRHRPQGIEYCNDEPPLLDTEVGTSCAIDIYDDDEVAKLDHHKTGHHRDRFLERLESTDAPVPLEYDGDAIRQDAKIGTHFPGKRLLANVGLFHAHSRNNEKRNFLKRLVKVAPDNQPSTQKNDRESMMSCRQSKVSSKDRISVDSKRSYKSKKDSADEIMSDCNNEGLAVATRVDPSLEEPIYDAIDYDPNSKSPLYKNRRCRVCTVVSLLILTITVALAVVYSTKKTKEKGSPTKVIYVTEAPTPRPTTYREALGINGIIEQNVLRENVKFSDMDKDDPRLLAMDWILHKDEMQLELSAPNLAQRYVLALLAFQFDYLAWTSCGGNYSSPEVACYVKTRYAIKEYSRWLSNIDECKWYGVACLDGKVRELNLPDNNLIGEIPPEISILHNLDTLSLNNNCLYGSIPSEFGLMMKLQKLNLEENGLGGYLPQEFYSMASLTHLNLASQYENQRSCISSSGNLVKLAVTSDGKPNYGLEGAILNKIGSLRNLTEINVDMNYFSGQIPSTIRVLKQLESLRAVNNVISGTLPDELFQLKKLRGVFLDTNLLSGSIPDNIGKANALEVITLFNNENMTGTLPDSLYNLTNLRKLNIWGNQFEGSIKSDIGNLKMLTHLSIASNELTGTIPSELGECEQLVWIHFNDNLFNGTVPDEVCDLRNKNLYSDDPDAQIMMSDCSPDSELGTPLIACDCCDTCCDHSTNRCEIKKY